MTDLRKAAESYRQRTHVPFEEAQMRLFNVVLLTLFSEDPHFSQWILKGGNCLRLFYYGDDFDRDTRDIDFVVSSIDEQQLETNLQVVLQRMEEEFGIVCSELQLDLNRRTPRVKIRQTEEDKTLSSIVIPLSKMDLNLDERVLHTEKRSMESLFPDMQRDEKTTFLVYSLTEIVAEKMRALIQRKDRGYQYCKHLHDVWFILNNLSKEDRKRPIDVRDGILEAYQQKCQHAGLDPEGPKFFNALGSQKQKQNGWEHLQVDDSLIEATQKILEFLWPGGNCGGA